MQTPKARSGSSDVPQRKSPATPRTARQLKIPASDLDSTSSPNPASKTPKERSPKVAERRSPRSPAIEKKRPGRVSELESQIAQLQEELKKTKDQLNTSESWKRRAQQEAEDTKKQLETMSVKLEDCQQQLMEFSASEDDRVQELRKISHDRDKAWQSELEAVQKHHSMDSAALASAINEIQKLKNQLEMAAESEDAHSKHAESAHTELQSLRMELTETLSLVEKLKSELNDCRESEAQALELVSKTRKQLETADATAEMLRSDGIKALEAYNCISLELEESRDKVKSLEELARKLQEGLADDSGENSVKPAREVRPAQETGEEEETDQLKTELNSLKYEVSQLRSALEASETRYQEEYIQSTLQIRSAYEQVEKLKSESGKREAELEAELQKSKTNIEELRANLMDKETELQSISAENEGLNLEMQKNQANETESELTTEMKKLKHEFAELKASLFDKDTQLQIAKDQNEMLKIEIEKGEFERTKVNEEAVSFAETAKAAEQEALIKLGHLTEEADRSSRRAARVTEQLDAAQAANSEMEAELRRLKVQSDQWRKAAEAAAAMLSSTGNNGKIIERTGSLDNSYNTIGGTLGSPYSEDMDDESPKKKNMLKKIGVLWKKGQK
ncbi:interactor of constitutive active ROPs 2, chloroplastic [Euphorbia lathyris]|uniref:interactor of constitutive active ROPs 2, chloroplastic n=1 Tax=Euphorbia lathyris TaxID=212925 RepID=UPI003313FF5D